MKIALIADIHANLTALRAVLDDIQDQGDVDEIWNLGDSVGFGAFPDEVVALLRQARIPGIQGNYDRKILKFPEKQKTWEQTKSLEKLSMWRYTFERLAPESIAYLTALPEEARCVREGWEILAVHGSPASRGEHLGPDTPAARLEQLAEEARADIVVCGHSHRAFFREAGGTSFINPGSVGLPTGLDPRASYAVLTITRRALQVDHYRTAYDLQAAADAMRARGLPEAYAHLILTGKEDRDDPPAEDWPDRADCVREALSLGRLHSFEESHAVQTAALALKLFDGLAQAHGLSGRERVLLECAALLHDIGIATNPQGHHKHAADIIIAQGLPRLSPGENAMIALVARYHRKALPSMKHSRFAVLSEANRAIVSKLAALLRVADGLDRTHCNQVRDVRCAVRPDVIRITVRATGPAEEELDFGRIKSDLMQLVFARGVEIGT